GGCDDRRPRRRHARGPDQDGLGEPQRSHRQVQPAAPHRVGPRQRRGVRGQERHQASCLSPDRSEGKREGPLSFAPPLLSVLSTPFKNMSLNSPLALIILDGWGLRDSDDHNAVKLARPAVFERLWANYPHATLEASG